MLAGLVTTTEVETVVLGGGLSAAGDQLLRPLRRALAEHLPPFLNLPELRLGELGGTAGARGAALHALQAVATRRPQRREAPHPENLDPVLMLAFDHRSSTAEGLFGDSIPLAEQHCALSDAKTLIAAGAARVRDRLGPHAGVSILTDPESGLAAARIAMDSGVPLALALEKSGYRDLRLLGRPILDGAIDELRPQWGKVLVRWNPRDSEERKAANLVALAEAQRICEGCGMKFLPRTHRAAQSRRSRASNRLQDRASAVPVARGCSRDHNKAGPSVPVEGPSLRVARSISSRRGSVKIWPGLSHESWYSAPPQIQNRFRAGSAAARTRTATAALPSDEASGRQPLNAG